MTMNNVAEILLAGNYVYNQLLIAFVLLTVIVLATRFSETAVIKSGIFLFAGCLTINFTLSFFSENYGYFVLHWFSSSIAFFIFWYLTIYICEHFGRSYSGDGAMIMLLPVYFLPLAIFVSVLIKSVLMLVQRF